MTTGTRGKSPLVLLDDFVARLQHVHRTDGGYKASCPVEGHRHGDKSPSLKIWPGDHMIMTWCYAGLGHTWEDVYSALGLSKADWCYDLEGSREVLSTYRYVDEKGEVLFRTIRFIPKSFVQEKLKTGADPTKESSWNKTLGDARRVPYNLQNLRTGIEAKAWPIWLVEGEKSAELLMREGEIATTTPMGAGNWKREYAEYFRGAKVCIVPDNDIPGREYASNAARDISRVAAVWVVNLPGLEESQDIDDWLVSHSVDDLKELAKRSLRWDPDEDGVQLIPIRDGARFIWPAGNVEIEFGRLSYEQGNVHAEASVSVNQARLVVARRINLQSSTALATLASGLNKRQDDIQWNEYVDEAANRAIVFFREAGRSTQVTTEEAPRPKFLVEGLFPDMMRPTLLFGDSETSKSVLATCILCSIATGESLLGDKAIPNRTGPVLYLDWEDDEELFRFRVQQLARGNKFLDRLNDLHIHYYHPPGPLHLYVDSLAREIEREGFVAAVVDSRGAAQDGPLSYEAETNRFFDAIAGLRVPSIVIDHLAKSELEQGATGVHSFGSVFTRGRVVCSWRMRRGEGRSPDVTSVELSSAKWNHGARLPSRRFIIDWAEGLEVREEGTSNRQHRTAVYDYLAEDGPAGIEIIAASTYLELDTVKHVLEVNEDLFKHNESGGWEVIPPAEWREGEWRRSEEPF